MHICQTEFDVFVKLHLGRGCWVGVTMIAPCLLNLRRYWALRLAGKSQVGIIIPTCTSSDAFKRAYTKCLVAAIMEKMFSLQAIRSATNSCKPGRSLTSNTNVTPKCYDFCPLVTTSPPLKSPSYFFPPGEVSCGFVCMG